MGALLTVATDVWIWTAFSLFILAAPPPEGFVDILHLIQPRRSSAEHVRQPGYSFDVLIEYLLLRNHMTERLSTHKRTTDRQIYHQSQSGSCICMQPVWLDMVTVTLLPSFPDGVHASRLLTGG